MYEVFVPSFLLRRDVDGQVCQTGCRTTVIQRIIDEFVSRKLRFLAELAGDKKVDGGCDCLRHAARFKRIEESVLSAS